MSLISFEILDILECHAPDKSEMDLLSYLLVKEGVLSPAGMPAFLMPSGDVRIFMAWRPSTVGPGGQLFWRIF